MLARLGARPDITNLENALFSGDLQQKDVIELCGDEGTGKTQMLIHFITRCLLPAKWKDIEIGGFNAGVAFVDTDYHFSMIRLISVMDHTVRKHVLRNKRKLKEQSVGNSDSSLFIEPSDEDIESLVKQSLGKLHVVKCNSSTQFVLSLYSLDSLFGNQPDICLLVIDSISAFYWIDRSNGAENYSAQGGNQRRVSHAITKLKEDYNIITIVTKPTIFQKKLKEKIPDRTEGDYSPFVSTSNSISTADTSSGHCEYMCRAWQKIVTHRFLFSKQNIVTESKTGITKETQLFTVKGGPVNASSNPKNRNFYITEYGILFLE